MVSSKQIQQLLKDKKKALQRGNLEEAAAICNQLGDHKSQQLNYEDALEEHQEELQLSEQLGNLCSIAIAHRRVGETLVKMGKYQEALDHHKLYQEMAENCGDPVEIQRAWATVGWTNFNYYSAIADEEIEAPGVDMQKLLSRAKFAFGKSLDCAEKLKEKISDREYNEMKARILLNMALVYDQRKQMQACSDSLRKAIHLCKKNNLTEDLHRCQYSLACIYFSHGEIGLANGATDEAMNSARHLNNRTYATDCLILKSKLQISKRDYQSGKRYAKKASKTCVPASKESVNVFLRNVVGLCYLLQELEAAQSSETRCDLHEQIADLFSAVSCFTLAVENYQTALALSNELDKPSSKIASIYFSLAQTYADLHNYREAIEYWQQEIGCNEGNQKEICSTLLEIAKVKEKQGCDESNVRKTLTDALQISRDSGSTQLECNCLERLINFDKRQGKASSNELLARLSELQDLQESEDCNDETTSVSAAESFLENIDLSTVSDFSDSDDDDDDNAVGGTRKVPFRLNVNEKGETALHRACIKGEFKRVKNLIRLGHPVNIRENCGWLPIHEAANHGFEAIVEYLIEKGAWINDNAGHHCGGITPLHDAAIGGHLKIMKTLISKGACTTAVAVLDGTPLACLLNWKKQMEGYLDDDELRECAEIESLLRSEDKSERRGTESHRNVRKTGVVSGWVTEDNSQPNSHSNDGESASKQDVDLNESGDIYNNPLLDSDEIVNDWEDPDVARNEYQSVINNLRKKPVRKIEKRVDEDVDNPLHISDDWIVDDVTEKKSNLPSGNKKRKRTLDDYVCKKKTVTKSRQSPVIDVEETDDYQKEPVQCLPCRTIDVHIDGEVFAVPVPDPSLSLGWLAEKAADSYCDKHGMKPKLILVRKDRAVLSKTDSLASFQDSVVNAEVDMWNDFPLKDRFNQFCSSLKILVSDEVESEVQHVEKHYGLHVTVGSVLSQPYLRPFLQALKLQDNLKFLTISEINLSGNVLDAFCKAVPYFVRLLELDLRCCNLDCTKLKQIVDAFTNKKTDFHKYQLGKLDLSFNLFDRECSFLFKSLLPCFEQLTHLNLSFCDIGGLFADSDLVSVVRNMLFLKELNVSGNRFTKSGMKDYFNCIHNLSLTRLDLSNTYFEMELGKLISKNLSSFGKSLRVLCLRQCVVGDPDLEHISKLFGRCSYLEKIDVSGNNGISWTGLVKMIGVAKEQCLPLMSLKLIDVSIENPDRWESCYALFRSGQLKKIEICEDVLDDAEVFEQLRREWSSLWGRTALVSKDIFGTVTFSN